jgi:hypothetical protein
MAFTRHVTIRYSNLGKTFISRHTLHQHWYTCPVVLSARRNPQHRSLPHLSFNLFVISETSATKVVFYANQTGGSPRCKANVQVPTVVLELSSGLLGLYGVWHCHDEAVPRLPLAWTSSANWIPTRQQNFTVWCRIHIFTMLLKMG